MESGVAINLSGHMHCMNIVDRNKQFYEVAMEKREDDAYLVTGNQKHYPVRDFIVTPAEMLEILKK